VRRDVFSWYSHRTGREMPIVRYGSWGPALLLVPSWKADAFEAEQQGLIHAIAHHIEAGRVTVFSVNTPTPWTWCADDVSMPDRAAGSAAFSAYLDDEVVPHIRGVLQDGAARVAVGGASFGAFFAADALCRRPDLYHALIGMSGMYQLGGWLHGYSDDAVYFHSPAWYAPNLPEGPTLERLRHDTRVHLLCGRGAWEEPWETEAFASALDRKGIPHWLDLWGHDVPHDWPTWHRMLDVVVGERMGW
jgi:esterase/lipase superfamily enzyme